MGGAINHTDLLKRAFKTTFSNWVFWPFAAAVALLMTVINIASLKMQASITPGSTELPPYLTSFFSNPSSRTILAFINLVLLTMILFSLITLFVEAAVIGLGHDVEAKGETSLEDGFMHGWKSWFHFFLIDLIIGLGVAVLFGSLVFLLLIFFGLSGLSDAGPRIFPLIFLVILICVLIFLALMIASNILKQLSHRARVIERRGVFDSMGEAFSLFRVNVGDLILAAIIIGFIEFAIALPLILLNFFTLEASRFARGETALLYITYALLAIAIQSSSFIFKHNYWTLLYIDLRKKEEASQTPPSNTSIDLPTT